MSSKSTRTTEMMKLITRLVTLFVLILTGLGQVDGPMEVMAQGGDSSLHEQIDTYLNGLVESGFSGAVLVAQNGEIILHEGYGLANDTEGVPVISDTVFLFGSITKQFTAAAILHLEEQNLLSVEDNINEYLENVPAVKTEITIHQLLTHSSGLQNYAFKNDYTEMPRDEAVRLILERELLFEPGSRVAYSDDGYKLLAAIVEIVSGQSWQDYLVANLFQPAGMENTGFFNDGKWAEYRVANGYQSGQDKGAPSEWPGPYWALIGAGGVMTTVGDMYQWYLALRDYAILSEKGVEKLWTPHEGINSNSSYGYGWMIVENDDRGIFIETTGAGTSHNAYFHTAIDNDLVVIVASNRIDEPLLSRLGLVEREETIYAIQVGDALAGNVASRDFGSLPEFAQPQVRSLHPTALGFAIAGLITLALLIGTGLTLRRRTLKR